MKVVIEGNASKLGKLAKELRLRVKRNGLTMTLQEDEQVDKAKAYPAPSGELDVNIEDITIEDVEEVKAEPAKETKSKNKK